jgi:hypothetical protein
MAARPPSQVENSHGHTIVRTIILVERLYSNRYILPVYNQREKINVINLVRVSSP